MPGQPVTVLDPERYTRAVNGQMFSAETAVTGVAPGTAIGTTGAFTLQNLSGSGVNLVILEGRMGYVSGTLGAGVVNWLYNGPDTTAATGTAITTRNALLGGSVSSAARAYTTSTIVSPTLLRPAWSLGASLATTVVQPWVCEDKVAGAIVVPPGANLTLHATAAAGTTPLVVFYVLWAEVVIPTNQADT